jgi:hypothetical protein
VPQPLGMPCWEGIATSDVSLRIAWNRSDIDYTDADYINRVVNGISEIWTAELRYDGDRVSLVNVALVIDRTAVSPIAVCEVQDVRYGTDELIFTAYAHRGAEVMGVDLSTGVVTDHSNSSHYEEAEGVAPNGAWVLVERDLDNTLFPGPLDIWLLPLDGSEAWDRLTHFNRYRGGWYASNPAVSPDGTHFAFQLSFDGEVEGEGRGILLFDLLASGRAPAPPPSVADASGCSVGGRPSGCAAWLLVAALPALVVRRRREYGGRTGSTPPDPIRGRGSRGGSGGRGRRSRRKRSRRSASLWNSTEMDQTFRNCAPRYPRAGNNPRKSRANPGAGQCEEGDLNPHGFYPTRPST